jgi:hypothetical protein
MGGHDPPALGASNPGSRIGENASEWRAGVASGDISAHRHHRAVVEQSDIAIRKLQPFEPQRARAGTTSSVQLGCQYFRGHSESGWAAMTSAGLKAN